MNLALGSSGGFLNSQASGGLNANRSVSPGNDLLKKIDKDFDERVSLQEATSVLDTFQSSLGSPSGFSASLNPFENSGETGSTPDLAGRFGELDINRDGFLDEQELAAIASSQPAAPSLDPASFNQASSSATSAVVGI